MKATSLHSNTFSLGRETAAIFTCTGIPAFFMSFFLHMTKAHGVLAEGGPKTAKTCRRLKSQTASWQTAGKTQSLKVCCKRHNCMDSLPSPPQVSRKGYGHSYSLPP